MKKSLGFSLVLCLVTATLIGLVLAWPSIYPTGTTIYDPEKAFNGYTMFTAGHVSPAAEPFESPAIMYLINMNGEVAHTWKLPFESHHGELKSNGNLVVTGADNKPVPGRPGVAPFRLGGHMGWLFELDWEGNVLFKHFDPTMHHDFSLMGNGNLLYLGWEEVPKDLQRKIRGGEKGSEHPGGVMWGTTITEINSEGEEVWSWSAVENWDPELDIIGPIHTRNEWGHANSVDEMESGDIVFDAKHTDTVYIIDKDTKKVKWRWGGFAYLDKDSGQVEFKPRGASDSLGGQHCAHEIPSHLPGGGNILLYDNGMYAGTSRAVEIDPKTNEVVWQTPGNTNRGHHSGYISGAERLPNGNTLICSGAQGRLFEVTKENEIVWEYVHPEPHIFRAHRYAPDFCSQFGDLPSAAGPAVVTVTPSTFKLPAAGPPIVMRGKAGGANTTRTGKAPQGKAP